MAPARPSIASEAFLMRFSTTWDSCDSSPLTVRESGEATTRIS